MAQPSIGLSRGLFYLWNEKKLEGREITSNNRFYSMLMIKIESKVEWIIINVYAPIMVVGRRSLWRSLNGF